MSRVRRLTSREVRRRRNNRMSVLMGLVGLFMTGAGLWLMWSIDIDPVNTVAYGDALGISLMITVAGFIGIAAAVLGFEDY